MVTSTETKICSKCKERPQAYPDSGNNYCLECTAEYGRGWRARNKEKLSARNRARNLKSRFGLTEEQYDAMLVAQGGVCKCCGNPPAEKKRLAVDHDHACCSGRRTCGKCVRALLCDDCNLLVGRFESGHLDKVFAYLGVTV